MADPETNSSAEHSKIQILYHGDEIGYDLASRAVLAEHWEKEDWQDDEIYEFYQKVFAEIAAHPAEFVAEYTVREHGISFKVTIPDTEMPVRFQSGALSEGGVIVNPISPVDASAALPHWKEAPPGFEAFFPSGSMPIDIAYREPQINISGIRTGRRRSQTEILESTLLIGDTAVIEAIDGLYESGQAGIAAELACALSLVSTVHSRRALGFPKLLPEIAKTLDLYQSRYTLKKRQGIEFEEQVSRAKELLGLFMATNENSLRSEKSQTTKHNKTAMRIFTSDSYSKYEYRSNPLKGFISNMEAAHQEIKEHQIPQVKLYLTALEALMSASIK